MFGPYRACRGQLAVVGGGEQAGGQPGRAQRSRRGEVATVLDATMGSRGGCTAAKNAEEMLYSGERKRVVLLEAYRRSEWWLLLLGRRAAKAIDTKCGGRGCALKQRNRSHDVRLSGIASQNQGSTIRPAPHRQRIQALSRPAVSASYRSFTCGPSQNSSFHCSSRTRTRQLYIGQRRARFTFPHEKSRPPTRPPSAL